MFFLDPMSPIEFEAFKEQTIRNYADENIEAGYWHSSEAIKRSIEAHQKLLPDGVSTEGHYLFMARDAQSKIIVGYIWLSVEKNVVIPNGFIFVVFIYEQFRGRGYPIDRRNGDEVMDILRRSRLRLLRGVEETRHNAGDGWNPRASGDHRRPRPWFPD